MHRNTAALDPVLQVFARVPAGDQGDSQSDDNAARKIHNHVRARRDNFNPAHVSGADVDDRRVKLPRRASIIPVTAVRTWIVVKVASG
jgi:hypothetical protein